MILQAIFLGVFFAASGLDVVREALALASTFGAVWSVLRSAGSSARGMVVLGALTVSPSLAAPGEITGVGAVAFTVHSGTAVRCCDVVVVVVVVTSQRNGSGMYCPAMPRQGADVV